MSNLIYIWTDKDYLHVRTLAIKNVLRCKEEDDLAIAKAWSDAVIEHLTSLEFKIVKDIVDKSGKSSS